MGFWCLLSMFLLKMGVFGVLMGVTKENCIIVLLWIGKIIEPNTNNYMTSTISNLILSLSKLKKVIFCSSVDYFCIRVRSTLPMNQDTPSHGIWKRNQFHGPRIIGSKETNFLLSNTKVIKFDLIYTNINIHFY